MHLEKKEIRISCCQKQPKLNNRLLRQSISSQSDAELPSLSYNVTPILKSLMENATKNIEKDRGDTLMKFAILLYINAGSMAYEFIHEIPQAIPSLRTVAYLPYL